uniref:Uncharacterized protein n=1 Tax=Schistocephalus solidus TaxID=70667 RepID=A0A0X3PA04_SCHSO
MVAKAVRRFMHAYDCCSKVETQGSTCSTKSFRSVLFHQSFSQFIWFDDTDTNISEFPTENNRLRRAHMDHWIDADKTAFFRCRRLVQQRLWEMQNVCRARNVEVIQRYARCNETKNFFGSSNRRIIIMVGNRKDRFTELGWYS